MRVSKLPKNAKRKCNFYGVRILDRFSAVHYNKLDIFIWGVPHGVFVCLRCETKEQRAKMDCCKFCGEPLEEGHAVLRALRRKN